MYSYEHKLRVRYAETDQMGFVYHGHFFQYFEVARAEAIRSMGLTYADMEKTGVIMPVIEVQCRYVRPGRYDDLLTIKVILKALPSAHRIDFFHEVYNEAQELIASGKVVLYFMAVNGMAKTSMPAELSRKLQPYFI